MTLLLIPFIGFIDETFVLNVAAFIELEALDTLGEPLKGYLMMLLVLLFIIRDYLESPEIEVEDEGSCQRFVVSASVVAGLVFFSPLAGEAVTGPAKDTPLLLVVWDEFSIMLAYLVKVLATLFRRLRSVSKV
ncbi:hypothetical protein Tco_1367608 [Tanacetum coccineum]